MSLFNGVENFTPAFTGQQLAIQAGQGAGQSISRGMGVAQRGKEFEFQKKQVERKNMLEDQSRDEESAMGNELENFMRNLRNALDRQREGLPPYE